MRIQHNIQSMNAYRNYGTSVSRLNKHVERLSSGYRVNRAGDDAAGLAISEKMRFQITGLTQGVKNAKDGISLCQTADGALEEVHGMLRRMKELSMQAANGTYSGMERQEIQKEIDQILSEIDRISEASNFNGKALFIRGKEDEIIGGGGTVEETPEIEMGPDGVTCGAFIISGGEKGVDFDFDDATGVLKIISGAELKITTNGLTANRIVIDDGVDANITLANVNINTSSAGGAALQVNGSGNVTVTLEGNNILTSGAQSAGVQKDGENGTLTIQGTGALTARGGSGGAGIGGGVQKSTGNITIAGGTVTAIGGSSAAGIGGGQSAAGNNITISGGTVTATGGDNAAGIGGGSGRSGTGKNITISGGTVTAAGGVNAAGIGGGQSAAGSDILISGGTVTAAGGANAAGIGGGQSAAGSGITIRGGTVRATGGSSAAGIGGGQSAAGSGITISGGTVTATGGSNAAGIGGGDDRGGASNITISGGRVTATAGSAASDSGGAGIGGGTRGSVTGSITISGGSVTARGAANGAGIGGGVYGSGGTINITGGTVDARRGEYVGAADIGYGNSGAQSSTRVNRTGGLIVEGNTGTVFGNVTVSDDFEIRGGVTVEIGANASLTIEEGVTLTNNGTINNRGTINNNNGTFKNNGTFNNSGAFHDNSNTGGGGGDVTEDPVIKPPVVDDRGDGLPKLAEGTIKRIWIQCGFNPDDGIYIEIEGMDTAILGVRGLQVTTGELANKWISRITYAVNKVSSLRGTVGAQTNRLEHTIAHEMNTVENVQNAESVIRDTDVAEEMMGMVKVQILTQAGMLMMSQANMSTQGVLSLLQ